MYAIRSYYVPMTIRIVTDSVCDIPPETAKELQITVIPAYLNIGDESYLRITSYNVCYTKLLRG